jgi:regulator of CtrA degradation
MRESGKRLLVLNNKLVDDLYVEAMVLADEARAYLELGAAIERALLDPFDRVLFSCESLKVTTRVMQVIAWLLTQRAVVRGEISRAESRAENYRLGDAAPSDPKCTRVFPDEMRTIIAASESLYLRAQRLEELYLERPVIGLVHPTGPARDLMRLLESNF